MKNKEFLDKIKADGIKTIQLQFINIFGHLHLVEVPISQIEKIDNCDVMIDGSSIAGFSTITTSDLFLKPDWNTYMKVEVIDKRFKDVARVICFIVDKNKQPFAGDARYLLKNLVDKYENEKIDLIAAFEAEYFFVKRLESGKIVPADDSNYFSSLIKSEVDMTNREIVAILESLDFNIEAFHAEVSKGQHEITWKYDKALQSSDKLITFKWIVNLIAQKHGLIATFMPKPFAGVNGSGMHTNVSIFKDGKNIFFREDSSGVTDTHKQFMTGLINKAREIALITNPTVNSYKRLIPGFEAPNCIAWSDSNRSAMIRVPASTGNATRVEQRNVDPQANPYLALVVIFKAGMEGIEKNVTPISPVYDNLFKLSKFELEKNGIFYLPETLGEAITIATNSVFLKEVLGNHIFAKFIELKQKEWDKYRTIVHTWEIDTYLEY